VDGRRILKGFGMLRMFWTLSLSGAEDGVGYGVGYGDVSPYFIANCANLTDIANPIIGGNVSDVRMVPVISIKHPGKAAPLK